MGALASQLVVRRDFGSGTVMIPNVRFALPVYALTVAQTHHSPAPCIRSQFEDGNTVCDVGTVWNFSRPRRQGKASLTRSAVRILSDRITFQSRFLHTESSLSCPLPHKMRIHLRPVRSSMARKMCNSSVSGVWRDERLCYTCVKRG